MAKSDAAVVDADEQVADQGQVADAAADNSAADTVADDAAVEENKRQRTAYVGKDFQMEVLADDELPENATAGRSRVYYDLLELIAQDSDNLGKWHTVAVFGTDNGASTTAAQLTKQVEGKVMDEATAAKAAKDRLPQFKGWLDPKQAKDIPEYEGYRFEFTARRVDAGKGDGSRNSVLYSKLVPVSE